MLSVLIPNYNGEKILPIFLPSVIRALDFYQGDKELIIVDDCSTDNSIQTLKNICKDKATISKNEKNKGFSATCNRAAKLSKGDILFFLNSDVELPENFFSTFKKYFEKEDTFAVTVHGVQYRTRERLDGVKIPAWKRGNFRITGNAYPEKSENLIPSFSVQGAYFFVDKDKFNALKGFDEKFHPYLFEETDLCYRAIKRGWKIYYDSEAVGYHDHSTTLNSVATKRKLQFFSKRHRFIFTWKNVGDFKLLALHFLDILIRLPFHYKALVSALKLLPEVLNDRKNEKKHWKKGDRELIQDFFKEFNHNNKH